MIAKLENFGPFHFFFTLTCGDTRCDENFSSFLVDNGYTMEYSMNIDGTSETCIKTQDGQCKPLKLFLQEDIDDSLHEMIRTNVMNATRNFHQRVNAFKTEIIMGKNNPMHVKHISYRVEFQGRGAAHVHGTLWLDIKKIEESGNLADGESENYAQYISEAFRKLRDNIKLTLEEKDAIKTLTDKFTTCSLNPEKVGNMMGRAPRTILRSCQT